MGQIVRTLICLPIKLYQHLLRPFIKPCCRFYPSCSQYALLAIEHYGIGKGLWLTACRLLRCHPWNEGGYDPILSKKEKP